MLVLSAFLATAQTGINSTTAAVATPTPASSKPKPSSTPLLLPTPTAANVPYGPTEKQILDFYQAKSKNPGEPTPVLFFTHGGSWLGRDKRGDSWLTEQNRIQKFLDEGISIMTINYRFIWEAQKAGVKPPVSWPIHDAARALQFTKSKATEWNLNPNRIVISGDSAGACTSLWLAFHDDLANPSSPDPIEHFSTRPLAAVTWMAQTTLDPAQMKEWTPNSCYGGHAFGFPMNLNNKDVSVREKLFSVFLSNRDQVLPWIKEYSPYALASRSASPVYLYYPNAPAIGQPQRDPTHTANFGVKLQEHCRELGLSCEVVYPGSTNVKYPTMEQCILALLQPSTP